MKLTIVTINYNNIGGLQKTIKSVISQTDKTFEWVVIDGGSNDGSKELICDYAEFFSYFVSEPDGGIYNAMNKGIVASHGEFLLFLNSGDCFHDIDTIEQVLPLLKEKDIYVGRINSIGRMNLSLEEQDDYSPEGLLRKLTFTWLPHQASFIRKSVFDTYGLYREDMKIVSDWWGFFRPLVIGNATISSIPVTIANYDTSGISATNRQHAVLEQNALLEEYPAISTYYHFYKDNFDIVKVLKGNRVIFWLFRVYFYLFRKCH